MKKETEEKLLHALDHLSMARHLINEILTDKDIVAKGGGGGGSPPGGGGGGD